MFVGPYGPGVVSHVRLAASSSARCLVRESSMLSLTNVVGPSHLPLFYYQETDAPETSKVESHHKQEHGDCRPVDPGHLVLLPPIKTPAPFRGPMLGCRKKSLPAVIIPCWSVNIGDLALSLYVAVILLLVMITAGSSGMARCFARLGAGLYRNGTKLYLVPGTAFQLATPDATEIAPSFLWVVVLVQVGLHPAP